MSQKTKTFLVSIREVFIHTVEVDAATAEEAVDLAHDDPYLYAEVMLEYSHTMDSEHTTTEEVKESA